jgi:hypothetical protein
VVCKGNEISYVTDKHFALYFYEMGVKLYIRVWWKDILKNLTEH